VNDSYALTKQSQLAPLLASSASASFGDDIHLRAHQPHPGSRSQRNSSAWSLKNIISHLPLILGALFSVLLCILIVVSINWPDTLQGLVSEAPIPSHPPDTPHNSTVTSEDSAALNETTSTHNHSSTAAKLIDYSAYTTFPLTPEQYRAECWKQQANHYHGGYWAKPPCTFVVPSTSSRFYACYCLGGVADVAHPAAQGKVCSSTITFMFDGNRGLMADLALIAQLAGLAREVRLCYTTYV
jgi:hypothetical protein